METRNIGFKRSRILRILHYRLSQRRPVVITSPTTGAETTDALTLLIPHVPFIFNHESTHFLLSLQIQQIYRIFCLTEHKPERLIRPQAGVKWPKGTSPRYTGSQQNECWRHERPSCRPYRASVCGGTHHRGLTSPSVIFSPLWGYYILSRSLFRPIPLFRAFRLFFVNFRNYIWGRMDFPHEVRFFAGIGPAHFPAETTRPLGRGCLPFSP